MVGEGGKKNATRALTFYDALQADIVMELVLENRLLLEEARVGTGRLHIVWRSANGTCVKHKGMDVMKVKADEYETR